MFSILTVNELLLGSRATNSTLKTGEMWKFHRSMTRPFFSHDRISHFNTFDRHAEDAITQMKARFRAGYPVDFQVSLMLNMHYRYIVH